MLTLPSLHDTVGSHIIADLTNCSSILLNQPSSLDSILTSAIVLSGATILNKQFHHFSPHGVTFLYLLSESHLSIHTWPEKSYASIDMYTCGSSIPLIAISEIGKHLQCSDIHITHLNRGLYDNETQKYYH